MTRLHYPITRLPDRPIRKAVPVAALLATLLACGGGNGGDGGSPPPPPSDGTAQNPCSSVSLQPLTAPEPLVRPGLDKGRIVDGDVRWRVLDSLWAHRAAQRGLALPLAPLTANQDVDHIAVLQNEGDLILPANRLDLQNAGVRFAPNGAGGYDVRRIDATFRPLLGSPLSLQDDDSTAATVPFAFSFYGRTHSGAFINSDGNITFEEADAASTERNVARLLTGVPRIAPFLADLDPSTGGRVFAHAAADAFTVTWCAVKGFESGNAVTTQAILFRDGVIEFKYATITLQAAVIGISPGRTGGFTPVDLSADSQSGDSRAAVGERFGSAELDVVAVGRRFYRSHGDDYDQLVIWTDQFLTRGAFAYEVTISNDVRGIGLELLDTSRDFGSAGRLGSFAVMDALTKYPADPAQKFLGENTTLSVLGQESGHRWLAFIRFRDHNRQISDALLGRGRSHWSFFTDSDASVMEGNDIEDLGGGSFRTVAAVERYSRLDLYAMGALAEHEVPAFFYVESPVNIRPNVDRDDAPRVGVTFNGTRRDVLIQDVVAVLGPRQPAAAASPKVHRQAFIYVVSAGATADGAALAKLGRIRREWELFFARATGGLMVADTTLR